MVCVVNVACDHYLKPFLLAVIAKTIQLLNLLIISPGDHDREQDIEAAMQQVPDRRTYYEYHNNYFDWAKIIVGFCFTAATGLAVLPFQIPSGQPPLPIIYHFFGLSVLLAAICILVSQCIPFNYCPAGILVPRLFHNVGLFFGVTAFFICITIPFPLWFKCAVYSMYVAALLFVFLCNLHFSKYSKPHGFEYPIPNNSISTTAIDPALESCLGSTSTVYDQACTNSSVRRERTLT